MNERIAQVAQKFSKAPEAPQPVEPLSKLQALKAKVGDFMGGLPEMPVPGELLEVGREKVEKGRDRVKDAMGHASEVLGNTGAKLGEAKTKAKEAAQAGVSTTVEYFNDDERGTQRKAVAAGVVGVAAMAGAYGVYRSHKESKDEQAQTTPDASDDEKQQLKAKVAELEGRLPKNGKKTSNELIAEMREEMKDTIKKGPIYRFGDKLDDDKAVPRSRGREAVERGKAHLDRARSGDTQSTYRDSLRDETTVAMDTVADEREKRLNENQPKTKMQRLTHNLGMTAFAAREIARTHKRALDARNTQPQPADPTAEPTEPLPVTPPAPEPETAQHNV